MQVRPMGRAESSGKFASVPVKANLLVGPNKSHARNLVKITFFVLHTSLNGLRWIAECHDFQHSNYS